MNVRLRPARSTLERLIAVNAVVIFIGAVGGTLATRELPHANAAVLITVYFLCVAALMALANYFVMRRAFRPLMELTQAMASINDAAPARPLPAGTSPDPDFQTVSRAVSDMLDRLAGESRAYKAKVFESIEDERRRIGRKLNDETSQALDAALLKLDMADADLAGAGQSAGDRLANSRAIIQHCLGQLRLLVHDLRPSMLDDFGLAPAVRWYVETHLQTSGLQVTTDIDSFEGRLPAMVETALYRICQESLANVVKHSRATRVELHLKSTPAAATLTVSDNGVGFDPQEIAREREEEGERPRVGLISIRERVEALEGTLTVSSRPGGGTEVRVLIPLAERAGDE